MKVIIYSKNARNIESHLVKLGHVIMGITNHVPELLAHMVRFSPHVVVLDGGIDQMEKLKSLEQMFRSVRFVGLKQTNADWKRSLEQALKPPVKSLPPYNDIVQQRKIIIDDAFSSYSKDEKLNLPEKENAALLAQLQSLRLAWMLKTAKRNAALIGAYEATLESVAETDTQEIAYRTLHTSFKSASYGRELVGRYLSFLALHVPGAQYEYLALPRDICPQFRYVHYGPSAESLYASACCLYFGLTKHLVENISKTVTWSFTGEDVTKLTDTSMCISGLCMTLSEVVKAQKMFCDWMLNSQGANQFHEEPNRHIHRAKQIVRDFWDFRLVLDNPDLLTCVQRVVLENEEIPALPDLCTPPSFSEYWQELNSNSEESIHEE